MTGFISIHINSSQLKNWFQFRGHFTAAFSDTSQRHGIPKGAEETAAELLGYKWGFRDPMANAVTNASENAYKYVLSRK